MLFGTAIPATFYQALSPKMLSNGFFSRMHIMEAGPRGMGRDAELKPLPRGVLETAKHWAMKQGSHAGFGQRHEVQLIEASDGAKSLMRDVVHEADRRYTIAEQQSDQVGMAVMSRVGEKTRRLALNYACSVKYKAPKITKEAVQWACDLVSHQTTRMLYQAAQHVSSDDFEGRCKSMLRVLEDWAAAKGDMWMPFWQLSRKLVWEPYETEKVRDVLVDQRRIEYREVPTGGPCKKEYRLAIRAQ